MIKFPGTAPITRLEVVIQVEKYQPRSLHNPTLANIHLVPGLFDPSWLGTIEGELQNTDLSLSLQSADLSAVVFDAAGNVLGGGSGFAFQTLPPGARRVHPALVRARCDPDGPRRLDDGLGHVDVEATRDVRSP